MVTNFCTDAPHTVGIPLQVQTDPFGIDIDGYGGHNMPPHDFAGYESPGDERWGTPVHIRTPLFSSAHPTEDEAATMISLSIATIERWLVNHQGFVSSAARGLQDTQYRGSWDIGTTP